MTTVEVPDSWPAGEMLTTAEQDILEAAAAGQLTDLSTGDPEADGVANAANWAAHRNVRAEFLADLLAGDRAADSGRLRSVKLRGARITGPLDLEARRLLCPLQLRDCYFEEPINLNDAQARSIRLRGCCIPGLSADGLRTTGSVELDYGFTARGEVRMLGAHIGGCLSVRQAMLSNEQGRSLTLDAVIVDQNIYGDQNLTVRGEVSMIAAHIGGHLTINGASLTNENATALIADSLTVGLSLDCRALAARGEVRMSGARIGGQLIFDGASLANTDGMALDARMVNVETDVVGSGLFAQGGICMARAQIGGRLDLRKARLTGSALALDLEAATIRTLRVPRERPEGCMDLTNTKVVILDDDESEWPLTLFLRGFAYDTFKTRDINTRARLQWLRRHPGRFTPQLYDQLAAVYRQAGQDGAARRVAIANNGGAGVPSARLAGSGMSPSDTATGPGRLLYGSRSLPSQVRWCSAAPTQLT